MNANAIEQSMTEAKPTILFIHGMFQNGKSWNRWVQFFIARGHPCLVDSWPLHDGEPPILRRDPPARLGKLHLQAIIDHYAELIRSKRIWPVVIGHSVGGLIAQKLAEMNLVEAAVAIGSVAPNRMLTLDWGFFRNTMQIANPFLGDQIAEMTADGFHQNFANTMDRESSDCAYEQFATHDSRNVLRDCMLEAGHIDVARPHVPILFIAGEKDQIIPPELSDKNARAYTDSGSVCAYEVFPNRGHFICGEPGWEQVATNAGDWIASVSQQQRSMQATIA
jgi:pimeloyl-ACP methyl ester carboxylesterase